MNQLTLKPATVADIPLIMQFIAEAIQHLKDQDIDQWQDGYPNEAGIRADIAAQTGYLALWQPQPANGAVMPDGAASAASAAQAVGYCCIDFSGERAYDVITSGQWNTAAPYAVVHRMTIGDAYKGKGLAAGLLARVDEVCRAKGTTAFRIDTHPDNVKMQHVLVRHGFALCGTVMYESGVRLAYDKAIV